jgi:transposase
MALIYFAQPPMDRRTSLLFHPTLDESISPNHPVRDLDELINVIDFWEWEREYHGSRGQPPIPPKLLAKVWLYGLSLRIRSSRRLEYAVGHNLDFIWLVEGRTIDHVTLSNFRKKFKQPLQDLFRQIVRVALQMGLARINEFAFDGTRGKANNARCETLTAAGLEKRLEQLGREIAELMEQSAQVDATEDSLFGTDEKESKVPPELADLQARKKRFAEAWDEVLKMDRERSRQGKNAEKHPAQIPITDPDSRVMPNKEGGFAPNYTPLAAVDTHSGLILAAGVIAEVNEHTETFAVAEQIAADFGEVPQRALADGLHATGQNIAAFEKSETKLISPLAEAVVAEQNPAVRPDPTQAVPEAEWPRLPRNSQHKLDRSCFVYNAEQDVYYCPQGQPLSYEQTKSKVQAGDRKLEVRVYRCAACAGCPLAEACQSKRTVHGRTITRDEFTEHRERHATRMATPEAREAYKRRLHAGETPFAHIKHVFGLRQFLLRGLAKVETEWLWTCTAYNLTKLVKYVGNLRHRLAEQLATECL